MLIPFRSKAAGDFFMQETHARTLLVLMGKTFSPQGVITADEMAAAIQQLNTSLMSEPIAPTQVTTSHEEAANEPQAVGLKQRAWPLLDMMQRASKKRVDVVWGSDI
jgi:hypothetical protein